MIASERVKQPALLANTFHGAPGNVDLEEMRLTTCLRAQLALPAYVRYRQHANAIQGQPGAQLLDIGCGEGETCRELANSIGEEGIVVGLDTSESRLRAAKIFSEEHLTLGVATRLRWVSGDARFLPFPSRCFDGVRIERTLQHVSLVQDAIAEVARVLRPDGSFVSVEPDWQRFSITAPNTNSETHNRIMNFWYDSFAQGGIAARMPVLCHEAGLEPFLQKPFLLDDDSSLQLANLLFDLERLVDATVKMKRVRHKAAKEWLVNLRQADDSRTLRWQLPLVLLHAVRK